jgi:hypothetical protein
LIDANTGPPNLPALIPHFLETTFDMSVQDIIPPFAKLSLPPAEEYRKRKVALISGQ